MVQIRYAVIVLYFVLFFPALQSVVAASAPELFVQLGHAKDVRAAAFSPDGLYVVTGSDDQTVKLWNLASGTEVRTFSGSNAELAQVAVSRAAALVAGADKNGTIRLWNGIDGRLLQTFQLGARAPFIMLLSFSSDGSRLVSGSNERLKVWDTTTGQLLVEKTFSLYGIGDPGAAVVAVEPHDQSPTGVYGTRYALIETVSGRQLGSLQLTRYISGARTACTPDGRRLLVMYRDFQTKRLVFELYEIAGNRLLASWSVEESVKYSDIALSPDGSRAMAVGFELSTLWDAATGLKLKDFEKNNFLRAVFSADSRYLLATGFYVPSLWDAGDGRFVTEYFRRPVNMVGTAHVSPDERLAVTVSSNGPPVIWDLQIASVRRVFTGFKNSGGFSQSGRELLLIDGTSISSWDMTGDRKKHQFGGTRVAHSRDGRLVAEQFEDGRIEVREIASQRQLLLRQESPKAVRGVVFSDNGRYLLLVVEKGAKRIDLETGGTSTIVWDDPYFSGADISPDGSLIAVMTWKFVSRTEMVNGRPFEHKDMLNTLALYDASGGREPTRYHDFVPAAWFSFSSDSRRLLLVDNKTNDLVLCEAASGGVITRYKGHTDTVWYARFNHDGTRIVSAGTDRTIRVWDSASGRPVQTLRGHQSGVRQATLSRDGRRVLSVADDYTVRAWDLQSGKELVKLFSFSDGEWIAITPEGYYNASAKGDRYLNVSVGNAIYGIENYREAFFRPDLVKLALSGGSLQGYRTLAEVKQPPRVSIVQTPVSSSAETFKLTLKLEEQGGGIGDVRLFLNGSAIMLDSARSLKAVQKDNSGAVYRSYTLKLSPGSNSIRAVAFNADNSMQSSEVTHQVTASFAATRKPTLHALVIGIQEFRNPKLQLKYAVADANLFADTLRKGAAGLFEQVKITPLTTREATTRDGLLKALRSYGSLNPDDLFILYIASHGTVDEGDYFLITSNVGALSTQKLKSDALSQTELKELVANIPSTKKLIVIDTCNAGQLGQAMQTALLTRGMSEDTAMKVLSRAVGSTILAASTSFQEALEGYQGHGLFTWALVQGLQGKADKGRTGYIRTTDLAAYVEDEVPNLAEKVFKRAQFPTVSISGQGFPVGKVR